MAEREADSEIERGFRAQQAAYPTLPTYPVQPVVSPITQQPIAQQPLGAWGVTPSPWATDMQQPIEPITEPIDVMSEQQFGGFNPGFGGRPGWGWGGRGFGRGEFGRGFGWGRGFGRGEFGRGFGRGEFGRGFGRGEFGRGFGRGEFNRFSEEEITEQPQFERSQYGLPTMSPILNQQPIVNPFNPVSPNLPLGYGANPVTTLPYGMQQPIVY